MMKKKNKTRYPKKQIKAQKGNQLKEIANKLFDGVRQDATIQEIHDYTEESTDTENSKARPVEQGIYIKLFNEQEEKETKNLIIKILQDWIWNWVCEHPKTIWGGICSIAVLLVVVVLGYSRIENKLENNNQSIENNKQEIKSNADNYVQVKTNQSAMQSDIKNIKKLQDKIEASNSELNKKVDQIIVEQAIQKRLNKKK